MDPNERFNQILIDYCLKETRVNPVDKQVCEDRHESEERLREEQAKLVNANMDAVVKAGESRIRIWVLTIGLTILLSSIANLVGTFIKLGVAQERMDQNAAQHEKYDLRYERIDTKLQEMQKQMDQLQWSVGRGGAP